MSHPLRHWINLWDYLDRNFWGLCRWLEQELSPEEIGWQPVPAVASIGWNLQHLGEMLDHYLTHVFRVRKQPLGRELLVTMMRDSQDDGCFHDLKAIMSYHRVLRPEYRGFLETLTAEDMDRSLASRPDAHTVAWAVGHIAEHESYHVGKCMLLRNLILAERQKQ